LALCQPQARPPPCQQHVFEDPYESKSLPNIPARNYIPGFVSACVTVRQILPIVICQLMCTGHLCPSKSICCNPAMKSYRCFLPHRPPANLHYTQAIRDFQQPYLDPHKIGLDKVQAPSPPWLERQENSLVACSVTRPSGHLNLWSYVHHHQTRRKAFLAAEQHPLYGINIIWQG